MLNFNHHLTAALTGQLSESKDVFAMMRKKILASQIAHIPSKGLTPEAIAQKENEVKDQIDNMPTTDLVHAYSQLTGVLSKEDQEEAEQAASEQSAPAKGAGTNATSGGDASAGGE